MSRAPFASYAVCRSALRCVSLKRLGYLSAKPSERSNAMWAIQIREMEKNREAIGSDGVRAQSERAKIGVHCIVADGSNVSVGNVAEQGESRHEKE